MSMLRSSLLNYKGSIICVAIIIILGAFLLWFVYEASPRAGELNKRVNSDTPAVLLDILRSHNITDIEYRNVVGYRGYYVYFAGTSLIDPDGYNSAPGKIYSYSKDGNVISNDMYEALLGGLYDSRIAANFRRTNDVHFWSYRDNAAAATGVIYYDPSSKIYIGRIWVSNNLG